MLVSSSVNSKIQKTAFSPHNMRDDIWSYFIRKRPSFVRMNCNAQFSEMFSTNVSSDLNSNKKGKIMNTLNQN